jgi:hypothetical protein
MPHVAIFSARAAATTAAMVDEDEEEEAEIENRRLGKQIDHACIFSSIRVIFRLSHERAGWAGS